MPVADSKKKNSLLPLLIVIFIISYGLMTMLIVEQGATIQSQGNLIKVLLPDSRDLWAQRAKAINNNSTAATPVPDKGQAPSAQAPASQAPLRQAPSAQVPAVQAPSIPSKSVPQHRSENPAGKTLKPQVEAPPTPASDLLDQRRALNSI